MSNSADTLDIKVPDIGDFDEVTVIELLVKPGDTIAVDQSLLTVESDKASMEIPSSHAGVVASVAVKLGDKVKQGSVVLSLQTSAAAPVPAAAAPTNPNADSTPVSAPKAAVVQVSAASTPRTSGNSGVAAGSAVAPLRIL